MSYYEITGADLKEVAKAAYDLSIPQGLGFLYAKGGGLSEEDAQRLIDRERPDGNCALGMDYVHGRSCKFYVNRAKGRLFISSRWYDHTESDLIELLSRIGMRGAPTVAELPGLES